MSIKNEISVRDSIIDTAISLKGVDDLAQVLAGLDEILALARYGFDTRPANILEHGETGE